MSEQSFIHETVLLTEAVDSLITKNDGVYVDATFGRGGHSSVILDRLSASGKLVAIDKDPLAVAQANAMFGGDDRFAMHHGSFADIDGGIDVLGGAGVDGVLADLGVSSPQLDDAQRGFSFQSDGPLDMRMDPTSGQSAAQWIAVVGAEELARVFFEYGEERFSRRIAGAIIESREMGPIETTAQLAQIIKDANTSWEKHKHPATRCFQAIRIHINNELGDLSALLAGAAKRLNVGGRLVVISFHSLEDRMVKRFMRDMAKGSEPPPGVPVLEKDIVRHFRLSSKAIKPGAEEVSRNGRARSAVMRTLEKVTNE